MANKLICKIVSGLAVTVVLNAVSFSVCAESYLYDLKDKSVAVPDAYSVQRIYTGEDFGAGSLHLPEDMFVDKNNNVYIADTGNDRILVLDQDFRLQREIKEVVTDGESSLLRTPKGVFVTEGLVYIADTGNSRIIAVDENNKVVRLLTNEGLFAVNKNIAFSPEKVAVDRDGGVFVVDRAIYQGIVQYSSDGQFVGFFAPNEVAVTAETVLLNLWKNLLGDEQVNDMEKNLPAPYSNVYIGADGFIYTVSEDVSDSRAIKRLNALGKNILQSAGESAEKFGDLETSYTDGEETTSRFVDVHVDTDGIFCGADNLRGRLFLYDQNGSLLAVFGGSGEYKGSFRNLTAVEKLGDDYLALDGGKNSITVFEPTDYMRQVRNALGYYNQGLYRESVSMWESVLQQNNYFPIAFRSIGRAYLQDGQYKKAMNMLKEGGDLYFYSLAFKEYRKEFVRKYFVWILLGAVAGLVGLVWGVKHLRHWILHGADKKQKKM